MGLEAIKKVLFSTPGEDQLGSGALKADAGKTNKRKFEEHLVAGLSTGNYPNTQIYTLGNSVIVDAGNRTT